jgi:hypothetical protein
MAKVRTFISFAKEDSKYRDFFVGQSKNPDFPADIANWSVEEPFDEKWKTNCRIRIRQVDLVIMLVGKSTWQADGACWEVICAKEEGIPVFGVWIDKNNKGIIPTPLVGQIIIEWTWDGIANMIRRLTRE